mgnify:CR=1 FL=1
MKNYKIIILSLILLVCLSFSSAAFESKSLKKLDYRILDTYPHDSEAFTQGFEIYNDFLYEGTGLYGRSSLRKVKIENGKILKKINLNEKYFGEGITILNDKIYQLSWKENTAFVYNTDFKLLKKIKYQGEGWGLTNDGKNLIMSNGSEYLYFRKPDNFKIIKKIEVKAGDKKIKNLNELEYHNGFIYANVWQTNYIVKINKKNGNAASYLDLSNIIKESLRDKANDLNDIAYDPKKDNFLITGKLWPKIVRIDF